MLKGYELGADDYVTKPFHMSVFQKKLAALFNRISNLTAYQSSLTEIILMMVLYA